MPQLTCALGTVLGCDRRTDRLVARVVQVFGAARAHHGYLWRPFGSERRIIAQLPVTAAPDAKRELARLSGATAIVVHKVVHLHGGQPLSVWTRQIKKAMLFNQR